MWSYLLSCWFMIIFMRIFSLHKTRVYGTACGIFWFRWTTQCSGAVSQFQGPWFYPQLEFTSLWSFTRSPHVCVSLCQVSSHLQKT